MSDISTFVVVISQETLRAFVKPGLDLQTQEIIELALARVPLPVQLELPLEIFYPRLENCQIHCAEGVDQAYCGISSQLTTEFHIT